MDLGISGLVSGFDWRSFVDQMADVERQPQKRLRTEQTNILARKTAYSNLKAQLETLKKRVDALKDKTLYASRQATVSDATMATASVANGALQGTYVFAFSQLAKAAAWQGAADVGKAIDKTKTLDAAGFSTAITVGTFAINGKQITVDAADTLESLINKINATADIGVLVEYSPDVASTDKIKITSTNGQAITLGSATDASNFLQAARLTSFSPDNLTVTSSAQLGALRLSATLASANFNTTVQNGASATRFKINGVEITYDATQDTLGSILSKINNSAAGVAASYDAINDRLALTNKATGDLGFVLEEAAGGTEGNFLAASGLLGGTLSRGSNLVYTVNGGGQMVSQSNTITEASSGLAGLSVTALKENSAATINVGTDTTKIKTAISDFITEFNKSQGLIDTQSAVTVDASGKVTSGVLSEEREASDIASQLRNLSFGEISGVDSSIARLSNLGINTGGYDNNLTQSDATSLDNFLQNKLSDLEKFFSNDTEGWATQMSSYLDQMVGDSGLLTTKQTTLTNQSSDMDTQVSDMERIVQDNRQRLIDSFVNMETAQSKINQQMAYLTKQLGG